MALTTKTMLSLADLYFTDGNGNYRFQWCTKVFGDQAELVFDEDDGEEYNQNRAKQEQLNKHLNDGSNGAASYRINIYDKATGTKIHTQTVTGFDAEVSLDFGEYLWEVEALNAKGQVITKSDKAYINTKYNNWNEGGEISVIDCSPTGDMVHVGDYWDYKDGYGYMRLAVAGRIENDKDHNFLVCGPAQCGNKAAWAIPKNEGYMYSISNSCSGFDNEFTLTGNCLITNSGIYEYEGGQWNYKSCVIPEVDCGDTNHELDYICVDDSKELFRWDTASDSFVKVLTAKKEIYGVSDLYYITEDGVFSIKDNSQKLSYKITCGECKIYDDIFMNVYAQQGGSKSDELDSGEQGAIAVQYYFLDRKNNKISSKKVTLFSGKANMYIDAEEVYDCRIGNCFCYVIQEDGEYKADLTSTVYIHEIKDDGSVTLSTFTCQSMNWVYCGLNDDGKIVIYYSEANGGGYKEKVMNVTPTFNELFNGNLLAAGNKSGISFDDINGEEFIADYSLNNFSSVLRIETEDEGIDTYGMPAATYKLRVSGNSGSSWTKCQDIVSDNSAKPQKHIANDNDRTDLFFANPSRTWTTGYAAQHQGFRNGWKGTGETVNLGGKNRIEDIFCGGEDDNILVLTDSASGDALFIDDVYSALSKEGVRLSQISEIRAGAGNDIIDMTSSKYSYSGSEITILGGAGDDVIWACGSDNDLFGGAGNDRIIGSAGFDVIAGGAGNDYMHSGGGDDVFAFCDNWGNDTVELLNDGSEITLWFKSNVSWDAKKRIATSGSNKVTVKGGASCSVSVIIGNKGADYNDMVESGAFNATVGNKIFE